MGEILQIALEVKAYVEENGRTLSVSQGKMLKDLSHFETEYYNKQTA